MKTFNISVKNLIEYVLRSGDITTGGIGYLSNERALLGTRLHRKIQKEWAKSGVSLEVSLYHTLNFTDYSLTIEGRADGVDTQSDPVIIGEIKTTEDDLKNVDESYNQLHWAQAICYGYIYALQNNLAEIIIRLTYCNIETEEIKELQNRFSFTWLEGYFYDIVQKYNTFLKFAYDWSLIRNESIKAMDFPFSSYRKGQRELSVAVYKTIKSRRKLFVQAPTGTGKTISTIFPAIKALGEDQTDKIFYLTAKTTTRSLPQDAVKIMSEKSLKIIYTTLHAKEKICFIGKPQCDPELCSYARGHYDRINGALIDALNSCKTFDRENIIAYAEKHRVCPFEFSLDLTTWSDMVICDYNYLFDPKAYLRRFFGEEGGEYVFLVDEAHNLADRGRDMFSAVLHKRWVMDYKKYAKSQYPALSKSLDEINKHMIALGKKADTSLLGSSYYIQKEKDEEISDLLEKFLVRARDFLDNHSHDEKYEEFLQLYFEIAFFIKILEVYDENYCTYLYDDPSGPVLKLFCLDPSPLLKASFSKGSAAILFSATLAPMQYYFGLLGGEPGDGKLILGSPFLPENKCIMAAQDVSTTYKKRELYHEKVADYLQKTAEAKPGNYFAFFPSYKYLEDVYGIFQMKYPDTEITVQQRKYTDEEKEEFISSFPEGSGKTRVGFCVLGGVFSEGIDMKNDRLIGAIIVGVGLPQVCPERELIKEYYSGQSRYYGYDEGFDNAYVYPGLTKVLQAAGRVIRTENDRGIILLLDERFSGNKYSELFPEDWYPVNYITLDNVESVLKKFW